MFLGRTRFCKYQCGPSLSMNNQRCLPSNHLPPSDQPLVERVDARRSLGLHDSDSGGVPTRRGLIRRAVSRSRPSRRSEGAVSDPAETRLYCLHNESATRRNTAKPINTQHTTHPDSIHELVVPHCPFAVSEPQADQTDPRRTRTTTFGGSLRSLTITGHSNTDTRVELIGD